MTAAPSVVVEPALIAEAAGDRVRYWCVRPDGFHWCAFDHLADALREVGDLLKNDPEADIIMEARVCERYVWEAMPEFDGW